MRRWYKYFATDLSQNPAAIPKFVTRTCFKIHRDTGIPSVSAGRSENRLMTNRAQHQHVYNLERGIDFSASAQRMRSKK